MILTFEKLQKVRSKLNVTTSFLRDRFFGNAQYYPDGEVPIELIRDGVAVAPFVAPEIGGKVIERDGKQVTVFTPPEIAPERIITRKNILKAEQGNGNVIVDGDEANQGTEQRKAKLIKDDLAFLDRTITNREEVMCSQALFYGQVNVVGEGYNESIQFWDQANKPYTALAGNALWTAAATATPIADFEFAIEQVQNRSGYTPAYAIMSPSTWALARKTAEVKDSLELQNLNVGSIDLTSVVNADGVRVVGTLAGITILTYNRKLPIQNANGTKTDVSLVPDGLVLFAPSDAPTEMAYGVVQINDVKNQDIKFVSAKRVPNMYLQNKNPAGIVVETKTAALPIPHVPDAFYVLKVIA